MRARAVSSSRSNCSLSLASNAYSSIKAWRSARKAAPRRSSATRHLPADGAAPGHANVAVHRPMIEALDLLEEQPLHLDHVGERAADEVISLCGVDNFFPSLMVVNIPCADITKLAFDLAHVLTLLAWHTCPRSPGLAQSYRHHLLPALLLRLVRAERARGIAEHLPHVLGDDLLALTGPPTLTAWVVAPPQRLRGHVRPHVLIQWSSTLCGTVLDAWLSLRLLGDGRCSSPSTHDHHRHVAISHTILLSAPIYARHWRCRRLRLLWYARWRAWGPRRSRRRTWRGASLGRHGAALDGPATLRRPRPKPGNPLAGNLLLAPGLSCHTHGLLLRHLRHLFHFLLGRQF